MLKNIKYADSLIRVLLVGELPVTLSVVIYVVIRPPDVRILYLAAVCAYVCFSAWNVHDGLSKNSSFSKAIVEAQLALIVFLVTGLFAVMIGSR